MVDGLMVDVACLFACVVGGMFMGFGINSLNYADVAGKCAIYFHRTQAKLHGRRNTIKRLLDQITVQEFMIHAERGAKERRERELQAKEVQVGALRHEIACLRAEVEKVEEVNEKEEEDAAELLSLQVPAEQTPATQHPTTPTSPLTPTGKSTWWSLLFPVPRQPE